MVEGVSASSFKPQVFVSSLEDTGVWLFSEDVIRNMVESSYYWCQREVSLHRGRSYRRPSQSFRLPKGGLPLRHLTLSWLTLCLIKSTSEKWFLTKLHWKRKNDAS